MEHPQNSSPACAPQCAVRCIMSAPHAGHVGTAVSMGSGTSNGMPARPAPMMRSSSGPSTSFMPTWSALADHDLGGHELLAAAAGARPGDAQRPAGAQACGQLALERAAALNVQGLVDRLVRDPHDLIIGEVGPEPVRDLLRAPRRGPAPVGPASVAPPDPPHVRARHSPASWPGDRAGQPVLHVGPQGLVRGELRDLRPPGPPASVPLGRRGPVLHRAAPGRGVPAQLAGDRRR